MLEDPESGVYKRIVLRNGAVLGAVLYGDTTDGGWYFDRIAEKADVSAHRARLAFAASDAVAALPESGASDASNFAASIAHDPEALLFTPWAERTAA